MKQRLKEEVSAIPEEMAWRKMESLGKDVNSASGKVEGISVMCFLKYETTYRRSRWLCGLRRVCLRPVAWWDCGFESVLCLDVLLLCMLRVVKVEMTATGRSLVGRSRTEWVCVTECDRVQK